MPKAFVDGTTTIYVGKHYEKVNLTVVKYCCGRPARSGGQTYYLFPDHLGSTHITANSSGAQVGRLLYRPWGEARSIEGTPQTNWRFTGQREGVQSGCTFTTRDTTTLCWDGSPSPTPSCRTRVTRRR